MPKYHYRCQKCNDEFDVYHSMSEKKTFCDKCEEDNLLIRVPSFFTTKDKTIKGPVKVGSVVKKHIEDAKKEVEEDKRAMKEEMEF